MLASGGFTDGLSIAGEEGTEAVISFNSNTEVAISIFGKSRANAWCWKQ